MKVEVYTIAWNEERYIEQFIEYYNWADKITVYDNHSTDNTVKIAQSLGCDVFSYGENEQDNNTMWNIKSKCWKDSKADWVIVCDVDEWLYHKDGMKNALEYINTTDATVVNTTGYNMISERYRPLKNIKKGYPSFIYDKHICFKPTEISDMGWSIGCHTAKPKGNIKFIDYDVLLLHYSLIGRKETKDRWKQYAERMSEKDRKYGFAKNYTLDDWDIEARFSLMLCQAKKVIK